jgi:hypothetical protein
MAASARSRGGQPQISARSRQGSASRHCSLCQYYAGEAGQVSEAYPLDLDFTFVGLYGLEITRIERDHILARVRVRDEARQSMGLVGGGVYAAMAEGMVSLLPWAPGARRMTGWASQPRSARVRPSRRVEWCARRNPPLHRRRRCPSALHRRMLVAKLLLSASVISIVATVLSRLLLPCD